MLHFLSISALLMSLATTASAGSMGAFGEATDPNEKYEWLENRDHPEIGRWIKTQNAAVDQYLNGSLHDEITKELEVVYPAPTDFDDRIDYDLIESKRQLVGWRNRMNPAAEDQLISKSGKYEVKLVSDSGSDLKTMTIVEVATGQLKPEVMWVKFAEVVWEGDESFLYSMDRDGRLGDTHPVIYRHRLGTPQGADQLIFEAPHPTYWLSLVDGDENIYVVGGDRYRTDIGIFDVKARNIRWIYQTNDESLSVVYADAERIGVKGFNDAEFGYIGEIDVATRLLEVLYKSQDYVIDAVQKIGEETFVTRIEDVASRLYRFNRDQLVLEPITLPGDGSVSLVDNKGSLTVEFQSYAKPRSDWKYDAESRKLVQTRPSDPTPLELVQERVSYRAHDGRMANIWLVREKSVQMNADTPVFLYGYGGFRVNVLPSYWKQAAPWFKRGGVVAIVTLPGGLEYGENWHKAGALMNKRNCFDDFATAGKTLIERGLTSNGKIVTHGRSNGGLLVAATMNLYPELFRAAIPGVGVMDLTKFSHWTGGKWWIWEYGDANIASEARMQLELSPFHNLESRLYPSVLVSTADLDDRVVASHSYKYAAKLQDLHDRANPALIQIKRGGSHSFQSGSRSEKIRQLANEWTFALKELGVAE